MRPFRGGARHHDDRCGCGLRALPEDRRLDFRSQAASLVPLGASPFSMSVRMHRIDFDIQRRSAKRTTRKSAKTVTAREGERPRPLLKPLGNANGDTLRDYRNYRLRHRLRQAVALLARRLTAVRLAI